MKGITNMKLENYEVHLPSYSIGSTIYNKIGPVCESYGRTVLVIGGEKALAAAYEKIAAAVAETRLNYNRKGTVRNRLYLRQCGATSRTPCLSAG